MENLGEHLLAEIDRREKEIWDSLRAITLPYKDASPSGVKDDAEKPRMDLIPPRVLEELAHVLTLGATKYSARNWEKGLAWSRVYNAALRHLLAFWRGENTDSESGLKHISHALCNVMFLLEFTRTHPELDDRVKGPTV